MATENKEIGENNKFLNENIKKLVKPYMKTGKRRD